MKQFLFVLFLVLTMILLGGCTKVKGKGPINTPGRGNPTAVDAQLPFERFQLSLRGMTAESEVLEGVKDKNGGLRLEYYLSYWRWNKEKKKSERLKKMISFKEGDAAFYAEIAQILGRYQVRRWDGFQGANPPDVYDGQSGAFEAELSDGTRIRASGSNNFPSGFRALYFLLREKTEKNRNGGDKTAK